MNGLGFWDFLRRSSSTPVAHFTPNVTYFGDLAHLSEAVGSMSVTQLWETQPHLRTVVSFLARNVAQLGLHSFERVGDSRERDRTSPFASLMRRPNDQQTAYELMYGLVGDLSLYDRAFWLPAQDDTGRWVVRRVPPSWVVPGRTSAFAVESWRIRGGDQEIEVPAEEMLAFTGYHPLRPHVGSPTIESLRQVLLEQVEAAKYREQIWKRGGRVSSVIERPGGAPPWSDKAREMFREDWYAKYTGRGDHAGGTPILEDGMQLKRIDFTASEQQWVEAAKLALATVASAFHVNPTMVGLLDNANYSNVREFRRMLYGETLGPLIAQIEARINSFLLPRMGMDPERFYVEFNIGEKLQGSFEEQAAVMSTLVGRPILTADEARALFNRPAIGGDADRLVTPLNVLIGGQASPRDSAPPKTGRKVAQERRVKAPLGERQVERVEDVLRAFFKRQGRAVMSRLGAGAEDWWDADRWNDELTNDLLATSVTLAETIGTAEAARLGFEDTYDADRTVEFLRAVAERFAGNVNETTRTDLETALADDEADPADVFVQAEDSRASGVAVAVSTFTAGFASREAAKQIAETHDVTPMKTWITGPNPRPSHAAMNGETVPVDEPFSNGLQWPAESGDVDEVAGCNCSIEIDIP